MPITPFHFGPGALFKSAAPAQVSWTVFALANILIDLEPIGMFVLTGEPTHPWLHTLPGAIAVAAIAAVAGRGRCAWFLRLWNARLDHAHSAWLGVRTGITAGAAWTGALIGTLSHILLDGIMHADVKPFWPIAASNPLHALITIDQLQWACAASGALGLAVMALRRRRAR